MVIPERVTYPAARARRGIAQQVNLSALGAVVFAASNLLVIKLIFQDGLAPLALASLRVGLGAVTLFLVVMMTEKEWGVAKRDLPLLALVGLSGLAISQTTYIEALKHTTASNVAVLLSISPMVTVAIVVLTRADSLRWRAVAGIVLAFAGAALVAQKDGFDLRGGDGLLGDMLSIVSAIAWGVYLVLQAPLLQRYSLTKVMAYGMAFGMLFILPASIPDLAGQSWDRLSLQTWGLVAFYVFGSGLTITMLWGRANRDWGATKSNVYNYLHPVFGILVGMAFLGESMAAVQIAGTVAVLAGLALAQR